MKDSFAEQLEESINTLRACEGLLDKTAEAAQWIAQSLAAGGLVAFCGNGGSAAQAQHFAAEIVGRFRRERPAYRALALTTDTSVLTAVGNDYSFDDVFARQVEGLLREGDVLVGLSTSGAATNVCKAFELGRTKGVRLVAMTGRDGGPLARLADLELRVPGQATARIQEAHLFLGHLFCDTVEAALSSK